MENYLKQLIDFQQVTNEIVFKAGINSLTLTVDSLNRLNLGSLVEGGVNRYRHTTDKVSKSPRNYSISGAR